MGARLLIIIVATIDTFIDTLFITFRGFSLRFSPYFSGLNRPLLKCCYFDVTLDVFFCAGPAFGRDFPGSSIFRRPRRRLLYLDYVARQQIAVQMAAALLGGEPVVAVAALLRRWNFVVVVQRNPMSSVGDFVLNETILSRRETIVIWYLHLVYTRFLTSKP